MTTGDQLQQQYQDQMNGYGADAANYENEANTAYSELAAQPGYSAADTAAIQGNPNAGMQYYNPDAVTGTATNEQTALNNANSTQAGANNYVENQYANNLGSDINQSDLTVSPEEQQNIKDVAAQTTAGQYASMQDQAQLRAAAQGNTSPAAEAAIEEQLGRQGAIDAGNAASTAELGANAAALSANQQYTGMKTAADTNVANLESANTNTQAANQLSAASTGGTAATNAQEYNQNTGESLANTADAASSARATTTANATLSGQQQDRSYLTGEQTQQQGAQSNAGNQELSAYGNEYSGANNATAIGSDNESKAAANTTAMVGNIAGAASGALAAFAEGGVITKPTIGIIGEHGPERVVKLGTPRRYRPPQSQAA